MEFNKKFQVYNKLQGLTGDYYSEWYGNSIEIKFSRIIFVEYCNYFLMVWIQNVYYVKINLFSTYVNEMSIKCHEKNLSRKLYDCRVRFYFIAYNYI